MSKRIGVVTGGGDCPGLNAVIRAVAKASAKRGWKCIGVLGGYEGLLEPRRTIPLDHQTLSGLLPRGGTILGTAKLEHCRRNCLRPPCKEWMRWVYLRSSPSAATAR